MEWYEPEVRTLEQSLRGAPLPERPTAFYGSSSIRMWTDLAADLDDSRALNIGFGGSTLAACVHFFERLVPPVRPASLVVYSGDNDLGDGRSPEEVFHSFRALANLVDRLLATVAFGFMSIKPSPARIGLQKRIRQTNQLIRSEIDKRPGAYYIDVYDGMLNAKGQPRPELYLEDGLHLSRAGYKLWANLLEPHRNRIFTPLLPAIVEDRLCSPIGES
jgi:lysophospholipase L1-like esterase